MVFFNLCCCLYAPTSITKRLLTQILANSILRWASWLSLKIDLLNRKLLSLNGYIFCVGVQKIENLHTKSRESMPNACGGKGKWLVDGRGDGRAHPVVVLQKAFAEVDHPVTQWFKGGWCKALPHFGYGAVVQCACHFIQLATHAHLSSKSLYANAYAYTITHTITCTHRHFYTHLCVEARMHGIHSLG